MTDNLIITISRQYGTGGREIGHKLAKRLGISFLDRELITRAAKKSGFSEELFEQLDKRATNSFLYSLTMFGSTGLNGMSLTDQLYLAQAKVIREAAESGPCVIVGRCGDYVLRERPNCLKVYLHASEEYRTARIMKAESLNHDDALRKVRQTDRRRADNYRYYTRRIWGHSRNYDLTVNTEIGPEAVQNVICRMMELKLSRS